MSRVPSGFGTGVSTPQGASSTGSLPYSAPQIQNGTLRQVVVRERLQDESFAWFGSRSDLPQGRGIRTRIGLLSDGTFGAEIFTSTGTRRVL
jgi:hypothetical protein